MDKDQFPELPKGMRVLDACGTAPRAQLLLLLVCGSEQAIDCLQSDLAAFFEEFSIEEFSAEFPLALERLLGDQLGAVRPRWAKGAANRVATLLSDHIDELERKDEFLANFFAGEG